MVSREILNSHPISTLKKEISKVNIKKYSKLTKPQLVELMMKYKERFGHIKMAEKKARAPRAAKPKKEDKPGPVQGPRNLKKGFGIKRLPKKEDDLPQADPDKAIPLPAPPAKPKKKRAKKAVKKTTFEKASKDDKKKVADALRAATKGVPKIKKKKEDKVTSPKPSAAGPGKDAKDAMFEKITGDSVDNLPKYKPNAWKKKFWAAVTKRIRDGSWNEGKMKGYIFGFFDDLPEKYRDYFVTGNGDAVKVNLDMGEFKTARWLFYNRFLHRDKPGDPYPVSGYLLMSVFKDANKTAVNDKYPGTALTAKYYSDTDEDGDNERLTGPLYYISLVRDREWF